MSWIVLVLSGGFEAVWATALGRSEGFTTLVPTIVFGVALVLSMVGLAWAMREIPSSSDSSAASRDSSSSATRRGSGARGGIPRSMRR